MQKQMRCLSRCATGAVVHWIIKVWVESTRNAVARIGLLLTPRRPLNKLTMNGYATRNHNQQNCAILAVRGSVNNGSRWFRDRALLKLKSRGILLVTILPQNGMLLVVFICLVCFWSERTTFSLPIFLLTFLWVFSCK